VVALLVAISLGVTTILTPQETFSSFSHSAIFTLMGIFIMAEGLHRTGVTEQIGNQLLRLAGPREGRLVLVVMLDRDCAQPTIKPDRSNAEGCIVPGEI
jgi:di/tricarboxylate transporter